MFQANLTVLNTLNDLGSKGNRTFAETKVGRTLAMMDEETLTHRIIVIMLFTTGELPWFGEP